MGKLLEKKASETGAKNIAINKEGFGIFLKTIPLFSELPKDAADQILDKSVIRKYEKDRLLFLTGDKPEFFYIIFSGWIKLFRETRDGHESVVSVLTNGDVFGKSAILKKGTFAYSAMAVTETMLLQIPASFMLHMVGNQEEFDDFLGKFLESDLNEINQRIMESEHIAQMTSAERVGCFLLKQCGLQRKGSITIHLPYEKSLVAGRLGMTPETFSRSLNQLTAVGIETHQAEITIHNIEQLQAHICGHCSAMKEDCGLGEDEEAVSD